MWVLELIDEFVSDKQKKPLPKSLLFQGLFLENPNHVQAMDQKWVLWIWFHEYFGF